MIVIKLISQFYYNGYKIYKHLRFFTYFDNNYEHLQ